MKAARILSWPPLKAGTLDLEHASSSRLSWLLGSRWKPFEDSKLGASKSIVMARGTLAVAVPKKRRTGSHKRRYEHEHCQVKMQAEPVTARVADNTDLRSRLGIFKDPKLRSANLWM